MAKKINKIKNILDKIPWTIAEHAFLASLLLFLISLIIGGFLFYKYIILLEQGLQSEQADQVFLLREDIYQQVLKHWQRDEEKFQKADSKQYPNPFIKSLSSPEEK